MGIKFVAIHKKESWMSDCPQLELDQAIVHATRLAAHHSSGAFGWHDVDDALVYGLSLEAGIKAEYATYTAEETDFRFMLTQENFFLFQVSGALYETSHDASLESVLKAVQQLLSKRKLRKPSSDKQND